MGTAAPGTWGVKPRRAARASGLAKVRLEARHQAQSRRAVTARRARGQWPELGTDQGQGWEAKRKHIVLTMILRTHRPGTQNTT